VLYKSNSSTGLYNPYNSRSFTLPEFLNNRHMEMSRLSATRTGRIYPVRRYPWSSFLLEAESILGLEGISQSKPRPCGFVAQCPTQLRQHARCTLYTQLIYGEEERTYLTNAPFRFYFHPTDLDKMYCCKVIYIIVTAFSLNEAA
jgi:hypothetical protein